MTERMFCCTLFILVALSGCAENWIDECTDVGAIHAICGVQNPEDLAVLPDRKHVLISQFGMLDGSLGGGFALYDSENGTISQVAPVYEASPQIWGSPDCDSPPGEAFSPHGIELSERPDGRFQILAVNHGKRESVEWFELINAYQPSKAEIRWRGCALAPEKAVFNAIASLPKNGGFLVTQLWEADNPGSVLTATIEFLLAKVGFADGAVQRWDGQSFSVVPGTENSMPNGIVVSDDELFFYVNMDLTSRVEKYSISGGPVLDSVEVGGGLDNTRWNSDRSKLLVATIRAPMHEYMFCLGKVQGACAAESAIVQVDPLTMQLRELFVHRGPPMGAFTAAVELDGSLIIGSFAGNRLIRVPML
ncbi:MAG: hypothetical protein RJQ07_03110 [Pseudomonadales bacterium]